MYLRRLTGVTPPGSCPSSKKAAAVTVSFSAAVVSLQHKEKCTWHKRYSRVTGRGPKISRQRRSKKGIEGIQFGPDVPPEIRQLVWKAVLKHRRVFESAANGRPLTVKTKPHKIRLRKDAKHRRCPEPKWGHGALRHVLTKWARAQLARAQLANGSFVMCPKARFCSRPHIVKKVVRGATKEADTYKIRICGDYVYVNSQCESLQANAPDVPHSIEKAAGSPAFWYTDGDNQYNGWAIEEGSRDIAAIWTPLGCIAPTVLPSLV